jgi:hypothetical protein
MLYIREVTGRLDIDAEHPKPRHQDMIESAQQAEVKVAAKKRKIHDPDGDVDECNGEKRLGTSGGAPYVR